MNPSKSIFTVGHDAERSQKEDSSMLTIVLICTAWIVLGLVLWEVVLLIRKAVATAQRMHRIPCLNCQFFSGNRHLKCALHPNEAMTESAIDCPDYCARPRIGQ